MHMKKIAKRSTQFNKVFKYKYNRFELLNLFNIVHDNYLFNILLNTCFARFVILFY